jgi:hypothetical protein
MTVPARTNTTTAAAEVLVWHPSIQPDPNVMRWVCPTCGIDVGGGPNSPTHAQHQADMLAAAGLLADPTARTEWGVEHSQGLYAGEPWSPMTEERARAWAEQDLRRDANRRSEYRGKTRVVRRTVTDWTPAEDHIEREGGEE